MEQPKVNDLIDPQHLDNNYEQYYFISWPDCRFFEDFDDDDNVIPVNTQVFVGCFVNKEWASGLSEDESEETKEIINKWKAKQ